MTVARINRASAHPLDIVVVCRATSLHAAGGGMERVAELIVGAMAEKGHRVGMVTTRLPDSVGLADVEQYMARLSISAFVTTSRGAPGRYSFAWWRDCSSTTALLSRPRVLLSISVAGLLLPLRRPAGRELAALDVIAQCHGTAAYEARSLLRVRSLGDAARLLLNCARIPRDFVAYRRAAHIIAVSDSVRQQLIGWPHRVSAVRTTTIPNGVDTELFGFSGTDRLRVRARLGIADNAVVGVFSGRIHQQKGVDLCIRAMVGADDSKHLLICGDGPGLGRSKRVVAGLGLEHRVTFVGRLAHADLSAHLSAADVALLPSRRIEGLSLSMLEAIAAGLPVIGTDKLRVPDDLLQFVRLVPENSVDAIREAWPSAVTRGLRSFRLPSRYSEKCSIAAHVAKVEEYM